jgi:hypothetical protein
MSVLDFPKSDDLRSEVRAEQIEQLRHVRAELEDEVLSVPDDEEFFTNARISISILSNVIQHVARGGAIGECQKETPYSTLQPIYTSDGALKWCCGHTPQHCTS